MVLWRGYVGQGPLMPEEQRGRDRSIPSTGNSAPLDPKEQTCTGRSQETPWQHGDLEQEEWKAGAEQFMGGRALSNPE